MHVMIMTCKKMQDMELQQNLLFILVKTLF